MYRVPCTGKQPITEGRKDNAHNSGTARVAELVDKQRARVCINGGKHISEARRADILVGVLIAAPGLHTHILIHLKWPSVYNTKFSG